MSANNRKSAAARSRALSRRKNARCTARDRGLRVARFAGGSCHTTILGHLKRQKSATIGRTFDTAPMVSGATSRLPLIEFMSAWRIAKATSDRLTGLRGRKPKAGSGTTVLARVKIPPRSTLKWFPISGAPTKGRQMIWLKVPNRPPQLAHANTWWVGGFSVECKPSHWRPFDPICRNCGNPINNGDTSCEDCGATDFEP